MKTIIYVRVSDESQNTDGQEAVLREWAAKTGAGETSLIKEKVSGTVPAGERAFAKIFKDPAVKRVIVQDIDRLGRDTIDILETIKRLNEKGINLSVASLGMDTLLPDGKENMAFKIVLSVMATLAETERANMLERQKRGISEAKKKGKYKGRLKGTTISDADYLIKYKKVVKELKLGISIRKTAKLCGLSLGTVQKVSLIMGETLRKTGKNI